MNPDISPCDECCFATHSPENLAETATSTATSTATATQSHETMDSLSLDDVDHLALDLEFHHSHHRHSAASPSTNASNANVATALVACPLPDLLHSDAILERAQRVAASLQTSYSLLSSSAEKLTKADMEKTRAVLTQHMSAPSAHSHSHGDDDSGVLCECCARRAKRLIEAKMKLKKKLRERSQHASADTPADTPADTSVAARKDGKKAAVAASSIDDLVNFINGSDRKCRATATAPATAATSPSAAPVTASQASKKTVGTAAQTAAGSAPQRQKAKQTKPKAAKTTALPSAPPSALSALPSLSWGDAVDGASAEDDLVRQFEMFCFAAPLPEKRVAISLDVARLKAACV